jgi:hypothetical protein
MNALSVLQISVPQTNEYTSESAASLLSSLAHIPERSLMSKLFSLSAKTSPLKFSLEIAVVNQAVKFYVVVPEDQEAYFESQLLGSYPLASITKEREDYLCPVGNLSGLNLGQLKLAYSSYYPLKTYTDFKDVDPLSSILSVFSKASPSDVLMVQLVCQPAGSSWQKKARGYLEKEILDSSGKVKPKSDKGVIEEKISQIGFKVVLRFLSNNSTLMNSLANSFSILSRGDGNVFAFSAPYFWQKKGFLKAVCERNFNLAPKGNILTTNEIATIWHMPNMNIKIPNIVWGKIMISEPPANLPVATDNEEEQAKINFIARTNYKNKITTFGIKRNDRRRHMYSIGKTGTGKSTLLANMAISDMRNREGLAVFDPHGDLCETLLDYVPSYRINDVCYFDPSDLANQPALNILQVENPAHRELIASGIVSIFQKLYSYSWGPRLEHILRNTLLSLLEIPNTTLVQVPEILTNLAYRRSIIERINDPVLKNFWLGEFNQMSDQQRNEAIAPILNKVGQYISSPTIRGIVGKPYSTIDLAKIMNEGKILLVNLSQGKLGEDNAALLGAMLITKFQLAAMSRVNLPENERRDFFLYIDEFQNFATMSFIKILSEARKYRLNLILANQYMGQLSEEIQKAIFGNVGSLIAFGVGAEDAKILSREFSEKFTETDLVGMSNFEIIAKLAIDNETTKPFFAQTLPLPRCINQNREKVIKLSNEKYRSK